MNILAIETSCDETAAAVIVNGTDTLSSVVSSQVQLHHRYGGVVPELASRKHIEAIVPVVQKAISHSGLSLNRIDAIAVTQGPGLIGALLVGYSFARACAYALNIPWVGVNHLHAHVNSVFLEPDPPPFPFVALMVSGGHTNIYYVTSHTDLQRIGQTRDDSAGEAYDKVSKMLGLGYPGGKIIDDLARTGDPEKILFPRAYLDKSSYDFSFSGLKSAVRRYIQTHPDQYLNQIPDIAAGFQEAVVDVLSFKIIHAAEEKGCRHIAVVGGVSANSRLREKVTRDARDRQIQVHIPSLDLCGDNAAMVGAAGYHCLISGNTDYLDKDVYSREK
ncbi:MAG: tRNA (adenosine(37)-N6)-threonylcarbamoyltransferase complex transferase subunit TsaD [Desulfobacterales bacterium]|nr:tRNA (adenosine(37)-N6)-threonylcarbamoyltransferase complex transferase subunit TsaD [Desulfobacterales bacterium]